MNTKKEWKAKLESAYSFMLKYSKITVWPANDPQGSSMGNLSNANRVKKVIQGYYTVIICKDDMQE